MFNFKSLIEENDYLMFDIYEEKMISHDKILLSKALENISIVEQDTIVDLSHNFIREISSDIKNIPYLDKCFVIDLSYNEIESPESWKVIRGILYEMQHGFVKITGNSIADLNVSEKEMRPFFNLLPEIFIRIIWLDEEQLDSDDWEYAFERLSNKTTQQIRKSHEDFYKKYNNLRFAFSGKS